jgi:copper chaperone CopZ
MSVSSLFVVGNALRLTRFGKKEEALAVEAMPAIETIKEEKGMMKTIKIEGMMCKHCVAHVEKALSAVAGVASVSVSLENGEALVEGEGIANEAIVAAIAEAGYEAVEITDKNS